MILHSRSLAALALLLLLSAPPGPGQSISPEITGTVLDPSGAPISAATVTAANTATGVASRTLTAESGLFRIGGLTPGTYDLTVRREGFQTRRVADIRLLAGQRWDEVMTLDLAAVSQEVTVRAEAETLNTVTTHGVRGGALTSREASMLPVLHGSRGRNFGVLMFGLGGVTPGRVHAPFTANGNRPVGTLNLMVDSAEFNDVLQGSVMGRGTTEQPVSLETVESLEAQTSSFKAESGRASAAVVNLVTRSGGNEWRGSLYYLWQNSALNARNAMLAEKPPLRSHVPGMTLGGPLRRNRVFFFGGYEMPVRNTYSTSTRVQTLTAEQRERAVPRIRPLVDIFPLPNLEGTSLHAARVPNPQTLKSITGRIDAILTDRQRLSYRQTYLKSIGYKFTAIPAASRDSSNGNRLAALALDSTLSPRLLNQARLAYSIYINPQRMENPYFGDPALHGLVGSLRVTGLTPIVQFRTNAQLVTHNYSFSDDLSLLSGRHMLKGGLIARRIHANNATETNFYGTMSFRSVNDFLAGHPLSYTINTGDPRLDLRAAEAGAYFQDDWRATRFLTLNLGLRYERFAVPTERHGRLAALYRPDADNFAPRFGFAWNLGDAAKSVLRGGYGIYYNPLLLNMIGDTRFAPPLVSSLTVANPSLPPDLSRASLGLNRTVLDPAIRNPFVQNWNLTIERAFARSAVVSAAYVGTKADSLARARLPNGGANLAQTARPDPSAGVITRYESSASSNYHSLQLTARGAWSNGLVFRSAYTFGKSLDNASAYADAPLSENDLRLDRGVSDFNIAQLFNAHVLYPLPWLSRHRWLGGWQVSALFTAQSGRVYSILANTNNLQGTLNNRILNRPGAILRGGPGHRPLALAPGVLPASLQPPAGVLGTIGRNSETAPALADFHAALMKNFRLSERATCEFRVESFNLLNRVNYDPPISNIADPLFGTAQGAGDPRQFQLSLRVRF